MRGGYLHAVRGHDRRPDERAIQIDPCRMLHLAKVEQGRLARTVVRIGRPHKRRFIAHRPAEGAFRIGLRLPPRERQTSRRRFRELGAARNRRSRPHAVKSKGRRHLDGCRNDIARCGPSRENQAVTDGQVDFDGAVTHLGFPTLARQRIPDEGAPARRIRPEPPSHAGVPKLVRNEIRRKRAFWARCPVDVTRVHEARCGVKRLTPRQRSGHQFIVGSRLHALCVRDQPSQLRLARRRILPSRHRDRKAVHKEHLVSALRQGDDLRKRLGLHRLRTRHDNRPIAARRTLQQTGQLLLGNEIEGVAVVKKTTRDPADGLSVEPSAGVDGELLLETLGIHPVVVKRPVDEHVVVNRGGLRNRLDARHIGVEDVSRPPERIEPVHLARCIKRPSGPFRLGRRIAEAVIEHVVDARKEKPVEKRLHRTGRLAEVFAHPRAAFGGDKRIGRRAEVFHVRRGRGELRDEDVAVARTHERGRDTRILRSRLVAAEHFGLGDVGKRIEIKPVRRRPMRLVARTDAARRAPRRPLRKDILDHHLGQRLAVITLDTPDCVRIAHARELGIMVLDPISAALQKRRRKLLRPPSAEILVAVVVQVFGFRGIRRIKRRGERREKARHGGRRERIHHRAVPTRSGPLHLLPRRPHGQHDFPALPFATPEDSRFLGRRRIDLNHPCTVFGRQLRSAEAPAAPGREIHADALLPRESNGHREGLQPLRRQNNSVIRIVPDRIDRDHVKSTHPDLHHLLDLQTKPFLVDGGPHPPVVGPRTRILGRSRPDSS